MSDIAYILFGTRAPSGSGKKPSPPSAAHNINEPMLIVRWVAPPPPKTPSPTPRTAGSRLIPAIGASPSPLYSSNESRAPKQSLRVELFTGGLFQTSLSKNPSNLQPSSLGYSWSQPKNRTDKDTAWAPPTMSYNDTRSRSSSSPPLTPYGSISSLNSVKRMPGTPSETPAQLNMTMMARFTPLAEPPTKRPRVTASVSTTASPASFLPYLNSPRLDGKLGAAEHGSREAVKMVLPPMKPPTAPIPPVPPLPSGSRSSPSAITSKPSKDSKPTISSLTSTLGVAGTSAATINTATYVPPTPTVPAGVNHPPRLPTRVRNRSATCSHIPKQIPLPLFPTPTESSSSSAGSSAGTSPSPAVTRKHRQRPAPSATEVAGRRAGEVERKSAPNIPSTVTDFGFPLPPTRIPPTPAKAAQEAGQAAQSSRQRPHEPISRPPTPSALTPATYVPIDRIVASRTPPPPSTSPAQDPQKWQHPPAPSTTASRRLKHPKRSTVPLYESFLPSFDDMEERPSNTIPRLPRASRAGSRTTLSSMHPPPTSIAATS